MTSRPQVRPATPISWREEYDLQTKRVAKLEDAVNANQRTIARLQDENRRLREALRGMVEHYTNGSYTLVQVK